MDQMPKDLPLAAKVVNAALPTVIGTGVTGITGNPMLGKAAWTAGKVATSVAPKETALTVTVIGIGVVLLPVCFLMGPVIALGAAMAVPVHLACESARSEKKA